MKDDIKLFEKSTRKIVREEIETESHNLLDEIQAEMKLSGMRLESSIGNLSNRIKNLEIHIVHLEKSNKEVATEVRKLRKDLDSNIRLSDKWEIFLEKRIKAVENRLQIETPDFTSG